MILSFGTRFVPKIFSTFSIASIMRTETMGRGNRKRMTDFKIEAINRLCEQGDRIMKDAHTVFH